MSLTRTPERRAAFQQNNPGLPYSVFDAVDGRALSAADIAATGLFQPGLNYSAGAFGGALSHHHLWQEAAAGDTPLTIVEDDAVFRADFLARQEELLATLPPDWDYVLWGFNFDSSVGLRLPFGLPTVLSFSHNHIAQAVQNFHGFTAPPLLCRLDFSFGLPAYTISPSGARRFLAGLFPLRDYSRTYPMIPRPVRNACIDIAMNQLYPASSAHVCFPPLVVTPNDRTVSTIQNAETVKG